MKAARKSPHEFSRPLELHELDDGVVELTITADAAERAALASRFELHGLHCLSARLAVTRVPESALVRVTGVLHAKAEQRCVVTLEPIAACIDEPFEALYGPEDGGAEIADTQLEEATPPEPFEGEGIDVGELVAQQFALALDPYPRKSDAVAVEFNASERASDVDDEAGKPFSALSNWRSKRE